MKEPSATAPALELTPQAIANGPGRTPTRRRVLAGETKPEEVVQWAAVLPADR